MHFMDLSSFLDPKRNQKYGGFCGGVIIEDWLILTAAHCVNPNNLNRAFSPSELTVKIGYIGQSKL